MIAPWTAEQDRQLLDLQAGGHSATEIGRTMHKTRNAIIGRLWRLRQVGLGLPVRKAGKRATLPKEPKPEPVLRYPKEKPVTLSTAANIGTMPPKAHITKRPWREVMDEAFSPIPGSRPTRLMDRAPMSCAWPVGGDGEGLLSCSMPTTGHVYCDHHRRIAYVQAKPLDVKRYMRMR